MIRRAVLFVAISWSTVLATTASAQDEREIDQRANYAFAAYMGNGFYTALENSLYVLNVPLTFDVAEKGRFRLTVSSGFFDYDPSALEDLFPDSVGTLTVLPGYEFTYDVTPNWELIPHIDAGYATNLSTHEDAAVYSVGVHSRYYPDGDRTSDVWVNKILLAGYKSLSGGKAEADGYSKLLTGYDHKFEKEFFLFESQVVPTIYGLVAWEQNGVVKLDAVTDKVQQSPNYEIGISLYAPRPIDLGFMSVRRIGIGYHYNEFAYAIRLFMGTPF